MKLFYSLLLFVIAGICWRWVGTWNNLITILFGIVGLLFLLSFIWGILTKPEYMYGQAGAVYQRVRHEPEHDINGAEVRFSKDGTSHINRDGKTFKLIRRAPMNSRTSWIQRLDDAKKKEG